MTKNAANLRPAILLAAGALFAAPARVDAQLAADHELQIVREAERKWSEAVERMQAAQSRLDRARESAALLEIELAGIDEKSREAALAREALTSLRTDLEKLDGDLAAFHSAYSQEPTNSSLYARIQETARALAALRDRMGEISAHAAELESALGALEKARPGIAKRAKDLAAQLGRLERELTEAAQAEHELGNAFLRAVEAFPEGKEVLQELLGPSDKKMKELVEDIFSLDVLGGPIAPGETRALEIELSGGVGADVGFFGEGKHKVVLTRLDEGKYQVTVVTEGEVGVRAQTPEELDDFAQVGGQVSAGASGRRVYQFDLDRSGQMVRMAMMLATLGYEPAQVGLDALLKNPLARLAMNGVGKITSWGLDKLGDLAGDNVVGDVLHAGAGGVDEIRRMGLAASYAPSFTEGFQVGQVEVGVGAEARASTSIAGGEAGGAYSRGLEWRQDPERGNLRLSTRQGVIEGSLATPLHPSLAGKAEVKASGSVGKEVKVATQEDPETGETSVPYVEILFKSTSGASAAVRDQGAGGAGSAEQNLSIRRLYNPSPEELAEIDQVFGGPLSADQFDALAEERGWDGENRVGKRDLALESKGVELSGDFKVAKAAYGGKRHSFRVVQSSEDMDGANDSEIYSADFSGASGE